MSAFLALLLVVGLDARPARGAQTPAEPFTVVHVTDTHVTARTHGDPLRALLARLDAGPDRPAFVVNSGDVTELGTSEEYAAYKAIVSRAVTPVYAIPGNHDVRWAPLGKEAFTQACGPLYRSLDHGGCHFVLLDSTVVLEHWGHFDGAQLTWLEQDLRRLKKDTPIVIFFHHWLGRDGTNIDNAAALLDVIAPYNVVAMMVGHGHSDLTWTVNGIHCFMARGLYQGSRHELRFAKGEVRVVRVTGEGSATQQLEVAAIPLRGVERYRVDFRWDDPNAPVLARRRFVARLRDARGTTVRSSGQWWIDGGLGGPTPIATDDLGAARAEIDAASLSAGWHQVTVQLTAPDGRTFVSDQPFLVRAEQDITNVVWEHRSKSTIQGSPILAKGVVYYGSFDGGIYAVDATTGKERWRRATGSGVIGTPVVDGDSVYVAGMDHYVYALQRSDGRIRWRCDTGAPVFASAAVAQGVVCIGIHRGVLGIDTQTGKIRWKVPAESFHQSRAASDGTRFFVGGWDNTLRAIDARTGKPAWSVRMGRTNGGRGQISFYYSPAIASPAVGNGRVYVCTNDGVLHALDCVTGAEVWTARAPAGGDTFGYSSPLFLRGRVYAGGLGEKGSGDCYALDAATGMLIWRCKTGADNYDSSPADVGGLIAIGSVRGVLTWIDANTGARRAQIACRPGYCFSTPTGDADRTYLTGMNGVLSALKTPSMPAGVEADPGDRP